MSMKVGIVILLALLFVGTGIVLWNQHAREKIFSSLSSLSQDNVCGNGVLENGETTKNCCIDGGCDDGSYCSKNNCVAKKKNKTGDTLISKLECTPDPKGGKLPNCVCQINPSKENLTIILNKQGIYNTGAFYSRLTNFLDAAAADVNLNHIGISYYSGNDVASLDAFIEQLYDDYNVGYAIIVGDELDLMRPFKGSLNALSFDLSTVRKSQPKDSKDKDWNCRDVALSWILPPKDISNSEKIDFVSQVFDTYTKYHKNQDNILARFGDKLISVQWTNGNPSSLGPDLPPPIVGYDNMPIISNQDFQGVEKALKDKVKLLHYYVHGFQKAIGLGLNPDKEDQLSLAVYTTLDEFSDFSVKYGTPALFVQSESCASIVNQGIGTEGIERCCWPQRMLESGVWAYYGMGGGTFDKGGNQKVRAEKMITKAPFLGNLFRRNHLTQYIVFGDITAHF